MSELEDQGERSRDIDPSIIEAATDPYISFVSAQVVKGVVEHPHVDPDWIKPRLSHIKGKFRLGKADAMEAIQLSEELARDEL